MGRGTLQLKPVTLPVAHQQFLRQRIDPFDSASTQLPCGSGRVSVVQMGVDAPAAGPSIRVNRVATGFKFNHRPRRASLGKQRTGSALSDERNDVTAGKWSLQLGYEILV